MLTYLQMSIAFGHAVIGKGAFSPIASSGSMSTLQVISDTWMEHYNFRMRNPGFLFMFFLFFCLSRFLIIWGDAAARLWLQEQTRMRLVSQGRFLFGSLMSSFKPGTDISMSGWLEKKKKNCFETMILKWELAVGSVCWSVSWKWTCGCLFIWDLRGPYSDFLLLWSL